jgi:predicted permease
VIHDVQVSGRRLRRSPAFTLFAVVTLALGIGAATAAYSALYAVALRPQAFDQAGLAIVTRTNATVADVPALVSWPDYNDLVAQQRGFSSVAAWMPVRGIRLTAPGGAEMVHVEAVTGGYFATLGVRPAMGRFIQPADDAGASPVLVLSQTTWRSQFDGDPAVVGASVRLGGQTVTIVGVAPTGFRGAASMLVSQQAGWVPLTFVPRLGGAAAALFGSHDRARARLAVAGRLARNVALDDSAVEVATIGQRLDVVEPLPAREASGAERPAVRPTRAWSVIPADRTRASLAASETGRLVLALPALVLLVACTNLANLVLSRGSGRRQEIAIRGALGASRWRVIREELGETMLIASAGGALGALVAHGLLVWTTATLGEVMTSLMPGIRIEWRLEPVVFIAAGAAALLAMVMAGLVPALHLTRRASARTLTVDAIASLPRWRGRSNLIALQVGVSVTLFLLTAISVRFLASPPENAPLQRLGQGLERVAAATVPFDSQQYSPAQAREALDRILRQVRLSPGVEIGTAAVASEIPGLGSVPGDDLGQWHVARAASSMPSASLVAASPEFFAAFRLTPERGRLFDAGDGTGAARVIVLNQQAANGFFGGSNPVGRTMTLEHTRGAAAGPAATFTATVIGVLSSSAIDAPAGPRRGPPAIAYVPFAQQDAPAWTVLARSTSDEARPIVATITSAIRRADVELAVRQAGRADVMARGPLIIVRYLATVAGGLATLALVLAMAGLYGVLSHVVARRTREMGLRIALGADPGRILRLIARDGARPVLEGLFIGLGSAWVIRQVAQHGFTGTLSGIDANLVLMAAGPLLAAAAVACYIPARRAARVDPNVALREP